MFRYVKLKNYKSLVNLDVDLTSKRNTPKKLVLVYGENGVGKSNFAMAFSTLCDLISTRSYKGILDNILKKAEEENVNNETIQSFFNSQLQDTEAIIRSCKTIGSEENMVLEFGFRINGKNGFYRIETDDHKIVGEQLEYVLNKNQTVYFDISSEGFHIHEGIIKDKSYLAEIRGLLDKYWGKHSFLSILDYEFEEKRKNYVEERISPNLYKIYTFFYRMSVSIRKGYRGQKNKVGLPNKYSIFRDLFSGEIQKTKDDELNKVEQFLNQFFTYLYSDIKQVYYKRETTDKEIKYQLKFKKLVYGKLVEVDYRQESTGTQHLLDLLPFLMAYVEGNTVIIDEFDTGIHDILVSSLVQGISHSLKGQLIITTHNTMLLESDLPKDSIYIFQVDENANKELVPITSFEERVHPNLNIRKRYLKGMYGGTPMTMDVDFDDLLENMR